MKIKLQAKVLSVEQNTSNDFDYDYAFDVTLDCGQSFKTASSKCGSRRVGWKDNYVGRPLA